jgi:succinoglycan biosynthesis transport protein ExoP
MNIPANETKANRPQETADAPIALTDVAATFFSFGRRNVRVIVGAVLLSVVVAALYLSVATPSYTAVARLILDMRDVTFSKQRPMVSDIALDSAFVESQVEVFKSKGVILPVIRQFRLTENPEFVASTGGMLGDFYQFAGRLLYRSEPPESELVERATRSFLSRLSAKRIGLSFVIEISFQSRDAELAANVANALTASYLADQTNARIQITKRATAWLQDSIRELRNQAIAADRAVVQFKTTHNIVNADGRLINEQQLVELNTQLVAAGAQMSEARARLARIDTILEEPSNDGAVDATVTDSLKSDVISKLRSQYLELANRDADWTSRYGPVHVATLNVRGQMREIRASILNELRRIAETYKSEYEISKQRQDSIRQQLAQVIAESIETNQAKVSLRELESNSQTLRTIHDDFLHRHMEAAQQLSFPMTEGRVISAAAKPLRITWPRASFVYAFAIFAGLFLGFAVSWLIDVRTAMTPARA